MNKQIIVVGGIIIVGVIGWFMFGTGGATKITKEDVATIETIDADPVETVLNFYQPWLASVINPSESPYTSGVLDQAVLSDEVRTYITDAQKSGQTLDPVLCQTVTPKKVRAKESFNADGKAEVLVLGRGAGEKSSEQAAVSLQVVDGAWQITAITCASGEQAPEREFAFDNEGFLLKGQAPLNPDYWYLVYEQNGEAGHTVPLFFGAESTCIALDESEAVCDEVSFVNPSKVRIQAGMTEEGAQVQRMTLLP